MVITHGSFHHIQPIRHITSGFHFSSFHLSFQSHFISGSHTHSHTWFFTHTTHFWQFIQPNILHAHSFHWPSVPPHHNSFHHSSITINVFSPSTPFNFGVWRHFQHTTIIFNIRVLQFALSIFRVPFIVTSWFPIFTILVGRHIPRSLFHERQLADLSFLSTRGFPPFWAALPFGRAFIVRSNSNAVSH